MKVTKKLNMPTKKVFLFQWQLLKTLYYCRET